LTQDFAAIQEMLMELESRYRSGTGKAAAGDLTAEVDPRCRQFVKDLEENLADRCPASSAPSAHWPGWTVGFALK
jgi:hypothetical protein